MSGDLCTPIIDRHPGILNSQGAAQPVRLRGDSRISQGLPTFVEVLFQPDMQMTMVNSTVSVGRWLNFHARAGNVQTMNALKCWCRLRPLPDGAKSAARLSTIRNAIACVHMIAKIDAMTRLPLALLSAGTKIFVLTVAS